VFLRRSRQESGSEDAAAASSAHSREEGFSLIEIAIGLVVIASLLLSVTAAISTTFASGRSSEEALEAQLLTSRLVEELHAVPYTSLLSFHGTYLVENGFRADFRVAQVEPHLVQVQIDVESQNISGVENRATFLIAEKT
jgi:Tfp pilus assembly protein PilV